MTDRKPLSGKVALITGVSRRQGIGAAIAMELARSGADVCTAYYRAYDREMPWGIDESEPDSILADLRTTGVRVHGVEIDLGLPEAPRRLFEMARARFGQVDILVNNAAYSKETTIATTTSTDLDSHYAVNVRAVTMLSLEFIRGFVPGGAGRIINITSGQGLAPMPHDLAYAATKGAIDALTLSLSAAVARLGITVNALDPGPTDTGWMQSELRESLLKTASAGRLGMPQDAARLVAFLASDAAGWVTGQVIRSRGAN